VWEIIEHEADAGVRVRAADRPALFAEAARALTDTITDVATVRAVEERRVEAEGVDAADLLVRFLGEVLYLYDVERFLTAEARVEALTERSGRFLLRGEPLDPSRHEVKTEVKAVTWHASGLREVLDGVEADVIFDL
jgi:SHS2 domain-containing protein